MSRPILFALLSAAAAFTTPRAAPRTALSCLTVPRAPAALMAKKGQSRYGDDGTRLKGSNLQDGVDSSLSKGFFSSFKWGTEVEVGPKVNKSGKKQMRGMARDNSDRGLGGNVAYRNTESARLGADESQRIRKARCASARPPDNRLDCLPPLAHLSRGSRPPPSAQAGAVHQL